MALVEVVLHKSVEFVYWESCFSDLFAPLVLEREYTIVGVLCQFLDLLGSEGGFKV
jgi:hypothetical protein